MAWNTGGNKSLSNDSTKVIPPGAPISTNPSYAVRGYHDSWDIERVYRDGVKKVTWVYRCIDAIAGNQARLPIMGHKDNKPGGEVVKDAAILDILNMRANVGEDSFAFRYRLSAQLLTSTRGAFVEIVRGRGGNPIALHLLPPQFTSPIPDPRKFVSSFEVRLPNMSVQYVKPEDVLWFKHPHPLDPYLSMTPLEAAGIAVELESLAKFYNRNFLVNDGRPGGLLVVKGEMDEDDKDELRSRFRGNIGRAGATSVVASSDGVDYVDTGASPREASYIEMRQISKEEILSAFGVPESVIGNAAGRTFSNAVEETRVFWLETMPQHLEMLARGMDALHPDLYFDFDVSGVPVLQMAKNEAERYLMQEFGSGLITANEYRIGTGRKKVDSELADSMLANPNLTPIGNTEKKIEAPAPMGAPGMPGAPMPGAEMPQEELPPEGEVNTAGGETMDTPESAIVPDTELSASSSVGTWATKQAPNNTMDDSWDTKELGDSDRWAEILDNNLERFFERQQRVVLEKATGAKSRKAMAAGTLEVGQVFDIDVWNKQMRDDVRPLVKSIVEDAMKTANERTGMPMDSSEEEVDQYVDEQMARMEKSNDSTKDEIAAAIIVATAMMKDNEEDGHVLLKAAIIATFAHLLAKRKRTIAEHEAQTAYNAGMWYGGKQAGAVGKRWVTRKDSKVRSEHRLLEGDRIPLADGFKVGQYELRFPGDPSAPAHLTINCRCRLRFDVS